MATSDDSPTAPVAHVTLTHKWAAVPEALLYAPAMSAEAVRVYGVLVRHGSDPENCYPTHRRIAALIGKSPTSVGAWIRQLEDAGWVDRVPRFKPDGSPDSNGYRVHGHVVEQGVPAVEQGGVPVPGQRGSLLHNAPKESNGTRASSNEKTMALALVDNPPPPAARGHHDLAFEAFWDTYPRRQGKRAARQAWNRAIRRANDTDITAGAQRYRDDPGREDRYTAHPATWLNGDRWLDEPTPAPEPKGLAAIRRALEAHQ